MTLSVGAAVLKYGAMAAAGQAVTVLGGIGSAAATASGALLVVPAAGLAAAAAIATLKLGVSGFADALKESDPAKYTQAIAEFPPAMAAAANAVRAPRPDLTGLRQDVQQRLFAGLTAEITGRAGTYLPLLRTETELGGITDGLNAGAGGLAAFAREGRTVDDVRSILDSTGASVRLASAGVQPFLQALLDVAAVGAEFLPGFASGLADGAQRFADFIATARQTGQLREWISAGLSAVGDLVTIRATLGQIVFAVFSSASTGGDGLLSTLVAITGQIAAFVPVRASAHSRLQHAAFFYGVQQHNIDAAEMFREHDITIEAGPDRHGITQGAFLYVFEPGGNRIELFGEPGILQLEPDYETRTWQMSDIDTGLAIGGAKLPWETYFSYGTPPTKPLSEHLAEVPGPPAPPSAESAAAAEVVPDGIEHSRGVANAPVG
ncbi:glyoxalase/bleomycin resistance protein/dioxygenase [Amycolatopsis mediterranei S699]|uniref:Glyoxalase/bleomycin resistance protein/dioxygenase n=2 Tax=Amycolatopsis mediterranei TaxID=33910 RepID=A0A0H3DFX6_AMYMU|nr:VOC family protein [Amycolatopsis mediterranei]ADJ49028.1 glyoxalase/bleomycin resistance protein/dioxygenase [Amycolatopsis mediterranei U32]AEK45982.1 glyoxalase/bleomycin resistance protein/dioxygenase [Amycolatopsis mediterranei S699]AFO80735.1 glyoxalase/bleomycin resistance protein/dioxygenase [Amycolatopsis mediterranei S699]AGT87863.1 glyoxalase/bleomycin resistance protein/dioxygenase [Amycolatopsis mediterranei RB]KDU93851.1 glyoxalase [Amycolatopsis mediterranei]